MKLHGFLSLAYIGFFLNINLQATVIIQGNDPTSPYGFNTIVNAKAFNPLTGRFYVGLQASGGAFALSKADRPTFQSTPQFIPIAPAGTMANNAAIEYLALSRQITTNSILAYVIEGTTAQTSETVLAIFDDGTSEKQTPNLNDASGTSATAGIVQIAANSCKIFAAVKANGGNFGSPESGIALIGVATFQAGTTNQIQLTVLDATTGLEGNKAVELDASTPQVRGLIGPDNVTFLSNNVDLYWDNPLQRLYIGIAIETGGAATDMGKSVVVAYLNSGVLTLQDITPDTAIVGSGTNNIVVAQDANVNVIAHKVRVMHNTTGPSYLIVNGNSSNGLNSGNTVFALPLVDNSSVPTAHGTLAKKDSPLTNFKFTVPATINADLPTDTDPAAIVGASNLPNADTDTVSDIVVIDDTVYITTNTAPSGTSDPGIFYSQALFDNTGKIACWTPWTKRAFPFNAFATQLLFNCVPYNGQVKFFSVDAKTGNITIVEGTTGRVVGITSWATRSAPKSLINTLNFTLSNGCYCALDLHQATNGFAGNTIQRYALFGGVQQVAFARISQAYTPVIDSPQMVIDDFSQATNFLDTQLASGCVNVLEYSRTDTNDSNFFFAGTDTALFAFADAAGNGFNVTALNTLDLPPFSGGSWQFIKQIPGAILDMKTSGTALYVLASQTSCSQPFNCTLYNIPYQDALGNPFTSLTTLFDPTNIHVIAQTGVGIFENILYFSAIDIISSGVADSSTVADFEQLVLATNQGLYVSDTQSPIDSINEALNQTNANWQFIMNAGTTLFTSIGSIDMPVKHTSWPVSPQDADNCKTYDRSSINQLSGADVPGSTVPTLINFTQPFIPPIFNAKDNPPHFNTLDPLFNFWSDGARRFFIFSPTIDPPTQTKLSVIPFNTVAWNVTAPQILTFPVLQTIQRFFWTRTIGVSGLVLAGTNRGVVGLT